VTTSRWLLAAVLVPALALSACGRHGGSSGTTATPAIQQAATRTQESLSAADPGADRGDVSLERMAVLPESAQLPGGRWKAGVNYQPVVPTQPTSAPAGQVEVLEVFWYGCGHCYALDPSIARWLTTKPPYIKFVRVPVIWGQGPQRAHARLYYTLEALGKAEALHAAVFDSVQKGSNLLVDADEARTLQLQLQFATSQGISEADFRREYNGPAVQSALQKADELVRRYNVDSVPRIVVNGKYQTDVGMAGGAEALLQLVNDLSASEKKR
jgi:thiol:disulfide interchange protein DsbA